MKKKYVIPVIIIVLFIFPYTGNADPIKLRINCTVHSPYEAFFSKVLEEICNRNNIVFEQCTPPVGRSLINVNDGIDDGEPQSRAGRPGTGGGREDPTLGRVAHAGAAVADDEPDAVPVED